MERGLADRTGDRGVALATLASRVIDDGRELVHAEIALVKTRLVVRATAAGKGIAMIVVALFLAQAALTTLLVGFALGLARWIGFAGGGAIVAVVVFAIVGLLVKLAIGEFSGDATAAPAVEPGKEAVR